MLLLWSVLLFLTGGLAVFLYFAKDVPFVEEYHRFNRVKAEAIALGNHVVYSRHNVSHDGTLRAAHPRQPWKILVEAETTPAAAALKVVYVHGFDVGFTQSIAEGNYLARLLRQWTAQKLPERPLEFHTFSWRADFGPAEHLRAIKSATAQAGALADFLRQVARTEPGVPAPPVVVLTHGLGAQLVLEALLRREPETEVPPLEALLLVQPAVRRIDLSKGTYEVPGREAISIVAYTGRYFGALDRVKTVLATCSSADTAVTEFFISEPELAEQAGGSKSTVALGTPYYSSTEAEVFPPNFRLIDLSPGRYLDMVLPSHGSLFDGGGRRALWSLWQRVLRQAGAP